MKHLLQIILLVVFTIPGVFAQLPGGVEGPVVWLHAIEDDSDEIVWIEELTGTVLGRDGDILLNYNSVPENGPSFIQFETLLKAGPKTIITVAHSNLEKEQALWALTKADTLQQLMTNHRVADFDREGYMNFPVLPQTLPFLSTYVRKTALQDKTSQNPTFILGDPVRSDLPVAGFSGTVPEVLVFDRVLTLEERNKIESFLAIKYGLTLRFFDAPQYVNSRGDIIWDALDQKDFLHRIAGIGRDDLSGLYQKQSTSSLEPGALVISGGPPAAKNRDNFAVLPDQSFLVWGDNGAPMKLVDSTPQSAPHFERTWYIRRTGFEQPLSTHVILDPSQFESYVSPNETAWLVVDRKGDGNFSLAHTDYYSATIKNKVIEFAGIEWDTDGSGGDMFRFEIGPAMRIISEVEQPACYSRSAGKITLRCEGTSGSYLATVTGPGGFSNFEYLEDGMSMILPGLEAGDYIIAISDANRNQAEHLITLYHSDLPQLELNETYALDATGNVKLDLSGLGYSDIKWSLNNTLVATGQVVNLQVTGWYTVTASRDGCETASNFRITTNDDNPIHMFRIYPNPTTDGNYFADIQLEESRDIQVRVLSPAGQVVDRQFLRGRSSYQFAGKLTGAPGAYLISILANNTVITETLVKQ